MKKSLEEEDWELRLARFRAANDLRKKIGQAEKECHSESVHLVVLMEQSESFHQQRAYKSKKVVHFARHCELIQWAGFEKITISRASLLHNYCATRQKCGHNWRGGSGKWVTEILDLEVKSMLFHIREWYYFFQKWLENRATFDTILCYHPLLFQALSCFIYSLFIFRLIVATG